MRGGVTGAGAGAVFVACSACAGEAAAAGCAVASDEEVARGGSAAEVGAAGASRAGAGGLRLGS